MLIKMKDDKFDENIGKGKILGRFVIEIIGTPKEHVKETMVNYVDNLKKDDSLEFVKSFVADPEQKDRSFSIYAELEIWMKEIEHLFSFCLDAMPSSVEILEPTEFRLKSSGFSAMLNDLQAKLHEVDLLVKQLRVANKKLNENASALLENIIMLSIKETPKTPEQISMEVGVNTNMLNSYLDRMVKENRLSCIDKKWFLIKKGKKEKDGKKG